MRAPGLFADWAAVDELKRQEIETWDRRSLALLLSGLSLGFDAHKNLAYSTVATAPSPATSGTSLVVGAGDGVKYPAVPFNAIVWPVGVSPTTANAEIVRVTARSTDTLTITRAQEGLTARTVVVGDQIAAPMTLKTLTDIEAFLPYTTAGDMAYASSATAAARVAIGGAGSVWRSDGSVPSWAGAAAVATTVAGLGTAIDGKIGQIRAGSSPFDFVQVIYDATYGKWMSSYLMSTVYINGTGQAVSSGYSGSNSPQLNLPYSPHITAGLSAQLRGTVWLLPTVNDGSMDVGVLIDTYPLGTGANSGTLVGDVVKSPTTAASWLIDTGWVAAGAVTSAAIGNAYFLFRKSSGTGTVALNNGSTIMLRWVA